LPYIEGLHIMKLDYEIVNLTKKYLEVWWIFLMKA
jgi:hypothetical protein